MDGASYHRGPAISVGITSALRNFWSRLTDPSPELHNPRLRSQAQLLSSILLLCAVLTPVLSALSLFLNSTLDLFAPRFLLIPAIMVLLLLAYGVSRTRHYQLAAWFAICLVSAAIVFATIPLPTESGPTADSLEYLPLTIMLSAMLLSVRATALWAAVLGVVVFLLPHWVPGLTRADVQDPLSLIVVWSAFSLIFAELRRRAESRAESSLQALTDSEQHYRTLFESNPHPMWVYDPECLRFLSVNDAAVSHYGYSRQEFRKMTLTDLRPPEENPVLPADLTLPAMEYGKASVLKHHRKDGTVIDVEISSHAIPFAGRPARLALAYDVTERRRVELQREAALEALRQSEERYRTIVETTTEGMWTIDAYQNVSFVNRQLADMLGYTVEEMLGQPLIRFVVEERRAVALQNVELSQRGKRGTYDVCMRRKDGDVLWGLLSASPLFDDAGQYAGAQALVTDITARKQAEQAVRESEQKFRAVVEQSSDGIALVDEHGSVLEWNRTLEDITGIRREQALGSRLWDLDLFSPGKMLETHGPDGFKRSVEEFDRNRQAVEINHTAEYSVTRAGGEQRLVQVFRFPIHTERGLMFCAVIRDVTEIRRSEQQVRFQARLLDSVGQAVIATDRDRRVTYWNHAAEVLTGVPAAKILGRRTDPLGNGDPSAENEPEILARLAAGEPWSGEFAIPRPDSSVLPAVISISPIQEADGRRTGALSIVTDITALKRAEAALEEERASLAQRVAERTAELSIANAELSRAARLKDEFLASMSHELRTPLNSILGLSEALQEQVYGDLNDKQIKTLRGIEDSGRHLLALINDILDVSKIEAGKLELQIGSVPVEKACRDSLEFIIQAAHKKRLRVSSTFDSRVTTVRADPRRLKQMLVNLLSNAVKFTPDGGAIGLEVAGDTDHQAVHLTVWDTGIGIPAEEMPRLFKPFVQLDSRLSRQYTGTGLGLALVYRMAEIHGGSISVESQVGKGSRFTISLPWMQTFDEEAEEEEPGPFAGEMPVSGLRRALVIEDSPAAAGQFSRYLQELGVETVVHRRAEGAIEQALATRPDVIILDILLPDSTGWEVLRQLKSDPSTRSIPVLIVSVVDERSHGLALGAAEYLVKPISRRLLQEALARLCTVAAGQPPRALLVTPDEDQPARQPFALLAEDNESSVNTFSDYLRACGYRLVVGRDGQEAVRLAGEHRPDIILMDVQMPGMDGLEAMRAIRAAEQQTHIPIIALTALAMPGDRERCLAAGADDYLSKPVSLRELTSHIERLRLHP